MAVGRYVSDLETGDVLEPVEYVMSPFIAREYAHSVEERSPMLSGDLPAAEQLAAPTLVHIDKIRLLKRNCPAGRGPDARIHYEYHARHHGVVPVGERLVASGLVAERYEKRGRAYLRIEIELRSAMDGRLLTSYTDTAVLSFTAKGE
jgi:hypothetical protein